MRTLKPQHEFLATDLFYQIQQVVNRATGVSRQYELTDLYALATQTELLPSVPELISTHFATAQNLLVYSWFYQPFLTAAELCAYTSVERALRHRFDFPIDEDTAKLNHEERKQRSFKTLYGRAIAEGLLTDAGFPSFAELPPLKTETGEPLPRIERAKEMMLIARNELAHGNTRHHPWIHFHFVTVAAELINQLFQPKLPPEPDKFLSAQIV